MSGARSRSLQLGPAAVTALALLIYLGAVLAQSGFDPYTFVRIGARYQVEHAVGEEGYDGQFVYFIARDPAPEAVAPFLDVPAYRYQRILLPVIGRLVSLGNASALPWALVITAAAAHLGAVAALVQLLRRLEVSRWYALVYGLFPGALLAIRLALPESLAYFLVLLALLVPEKRGLLRWLFLALAVFAKETAVLYLAAQLLVYLWDRDWRRAAGLAIVGVVPFTLFQAWLFVHFGEPGIGSGGAMATPFEWIPFMGFFRIGAFGLGPLLVFGVLIVPFVFYPAVWGLLRSAGDFVRRRVDLASAGLLLNAGIIPFLPFSTVREPGGLLRFCCGLVIAVVIYASARGRRKALNYALLWLALNAILFNI